jgi:putative FmdB family regulatory protein
MPIYEYECSTCGNTFELMHSVNADPPKKCETPKCKGKPKRLVSASGFILKGSGWYATDYPSESRKKGWEQESKQGKPEATAAPVSSGSASESAPAPAPAPAPKPAAKSGAKNPYTGGAKKSKPAKKASK